jgi:hypothetical protein
MQAKFSQLTQILSSDRLNAYRTLMSEPVSDLQILTCYAWNITLSESLLPSLHILEIALRNTIQQSASIAFGCTDWFNIPGLLQHEHERNAIQKASAALKQQNKSYNDNRIVAEVGFGFWTSLLDKRYEQTLWPRLLKNAFPYMPRHIRTRAKISKRFHAIRQLRNRVFHHEPIWHWQNILQQHQEIIEAITWIEPSAADFLLAIDRFSTVYSQKTIPIETALHKFLAPA